MAMAVVDLGSRRRTLLFMRADPLAHFVSCLVYLPRDRYTTAVRLEMQDILVRELGGVSIDYAARVSESPWALVHFTVRLPEGSRPQDVDVSRRQRVAHPGSAHRGRAHLGLTGCSARSGPVPIEQANAEHYAAAFPEVYKQAVHAAGRAVRTSRSSKSCKTIRSSSSSTTRADGAETGISTLIWYLGGQSASLSQLLPMLQSMGVMVLEERPFTVTRPDGLPVWIYQFKVSPHQGIPQAAPGPEREATAKRFADAVTAIWHGHSEIDRFNELVLRAGLNWQQVAVLRAYAKYLKQAGFSYSQSHIAAVLNDNAGTARSLVELFEALFCATNQERTDANRRDAQAAAAAVAADIDALVSLDTDRVLRAFASMIQATLRTNYFVTGSDSARARNVLSLKLNPQLIDELPLPRPQVRDLRVLAAGRRRAPAVRVRRPRRAALVGPPRGLPHRDPRLGQGPGGQERGHRARSAPRAASWSRNRRRRPVMPPPTATPCATRAWPATGCSSPGCSTSPTTST